MDGSRKPLYEFVLELTSAARTRLRFENYLGQQPKGVR